MKNKTITIDRKLYDKLIERDKQSELIFGNMLNGFALHEMIYDEDGNPVDFVFLDANSAFSSLTGVSNPTGKRVKAILPGLEQSWIDTYQEVIESKCSQRFQRYDSATQRWYDMIAFWVRGKEFAVFFTDVTQFKITEQVLRESSKELEASNKELEQFAYAASHDLQEPLRVVSMYCQLIDRFVAENCPDAMPAEKKAEMRQYLDFTADATTRMRFLIKDLLEFSRVGRTNDNYEMVVLNDVIENVINDFGIIIKEKDAIIEYGDMPVIMARGKRMNQIFHNLISNGMKFKSDRDIVISIGAEERDSDWLFSVSDTGIGIDEKYQERVFGIFKRLHTREEYPGTGIGLALVKKIVENHGGDVWVQSENGVGTTFFFTIPKIG